MPDPACQRLFSLQHYDRVSRDAPTVRRIDRGWSGFPIVEGLKAELTLPTPGIALPMREVRPTCWTEAGAWRWGSPAAHAARTSPPNAP